MKTLISYRSIACLAIIASTALGAGVDAAPQYDQGRIRGTSGVVELGTDLWSQSVTVGIDGRLAAIQFQFEESSVVPSGHQFELALYPGDELPPPSHEPPSSCQMVTIEESDLSANGLYTWNTRAADAFFEVGDVFAFVVRAETSGFVIAGNTDPGYAGGELFRNDGPSGVGDMAFLTYVDPTRVGAELTGVNPVFGFCLNLTTPQWGFALPDADDALDCAAFGFDASPGDRLLVWTYGFDDDGDPSAGPGGMALLGTEPVFASCRNLNTAERVSFVVPPGPSWDCDAEGFSSMRRDFVEQTVLGIAR